MTSHTPPSRHGFDAPSTAAPPEEKNAIGTIALVTAIVGFVFACIPGALIVGWILLPIAFVLSIVGLVLKRKKRKGAIAALILSIVGTIVGVIVFVTAVGGAIDDAFGQDVSVATPAATAEPNPDGDIGAADGADAQESASRTDSDDAGEPAGTRAYPYPLGTEISSDEWTVTIDAVDLDATEAVLAENQFNDHPEEGNVYILVEVTATYIGDDPEGSVPWLSVAYVSAGGNTFDALTSGAFAVAPNAFDGITTLYGGASTSGNKVLQVPAEEVGEGVLAVNVDMFSNTVFVAVQ